MATLDGETATETLSNPSYFPKSETPDDETVEVQNAITESLKERQDALIDLLGEASSSAPQVPNKSSTPERITIEDRIKELELRDAKEQPVVHDMYGDTWIFIDPPAKQPEQDQDSYERYLKRYRQPILYRKDVLTSQTRYFDKFFGPTAQFRTLRRRNLVNKLPFHVKYVIDLTPPSEGDEAVFLTTVLCCSEGVRLWYQSGEIWRVSKQLIGGDEGYASVKCRDPVSPSQPAGDASTAHEEGQVTTSQTVKSVRMPSEYSPLRHRSAIDRLLAALMGSNPFFDSATKLWTTFALVKYFGIAPTSDLTDYVIRWLRAYPNTYFLEVLPEVSLQIAEGLQNYELARDGFAIIVGEEALDILRRGQDPMSKRRYSAYGRKKEDLSEIMQTRVEYASKSFLERITNEFANFAGNGMEWVDNLPEFRKLSSYTSVGLLKTCNAFKPLLKAYVQGAIYKILLADYDSVPPPDLHHPGGEDLLPRVDRAMVYRELSPKERILSRSFWRALQTFKLFQGYTNTDIKMSGLFEKKPDIGPLERSELSSGTYYVVTEKGLMALIDAGQDLLNVEGLQPSFALPDRSVTALADTNNEVNSPNVNQSGDSIAAQGSSYQPRLGLTPRMLIRVIDEHSPSASFKRKFEDQRIQTSPEPVIIEEDKRPHFFDLGKFFSQAKEYITDFAGRKLASADYHSRKDTLQIGIANTLVCLEDSEWKVLPLWAGGLDDGSMGVFNDDLPTVDNGFSTAGPDIHDGTTPVSSSRSSSEFEVISDHSDDSTINLSMANNRGYSDKFHHNQVYSADSASSHVSETFSIISAATDDEEELARRQIEAQEIIEAAQEEAARKAKTCEKGKEKIVDETFADICGYDDDNDFMMDTENDYNEDEDADEAEDDDVNMNEKEETKGGDVDFGEEKDDDFMIV